MLPSRLLSRAVLRLSPQAEDADVRGFLQGLVTNDVAGDLPVWAGLLSPQGKALFDFLVWADGADLLIDCEDAQADAMIRRLTLYRLRQPIAIARDETLGVHWSTSDSGAGVPDPRLPALGRRWLGPAVPGEADADADWLAHRLSLGVTEGATELGQDQTLWLECNAAELAGVSFTKGCYVGQENTARMNWRQKINRRLIVVPIDRSDEARRRAAYPELGLAVDHLRTEAIAPDMRPGWLANA